MSSTRVESTGRRLGRPPASSSVETKERLVEVARRCFSEVGFEATTNRTLADEAGITTGALYHYFDSKLDIYRAVFEDCRERVYRELATAAERGETFAEKLHAVLEQAHEINKHDPSVARFLGAARIDCMRHPEIADAVLREWSEARTDFFAGLVDHGIRTGEVNPRDREVALALISVLTVGLTDAVSDDLERHRIAVDGVQRLLKSTMFGPPKSRSRARRT
jgi:AcrR family transcriptional regulator